MADNIRVDCDLKNDKIKNLLEQRATAAKSDPKAVNAVLEKIATEIVEHASFLVPAELAVEPTKDNNGNLSVPSSANISFVIFSLDAQRRYLPVFSTMAELDKWQKPDNVHMFKMDFEHIVHILQQLDSDVGLVLNPYTDALLMKRPMVMKWHEQLQISRNGHASHTIPIEMADKAYALNPLPFQMMNVLCDTARKNPAVNALWLRGIKLNEEHSYLLVVDFTGDRQAALSPLGEAARKFLGNKPLHIVPHDEGFGGKVVEGITPIYTKE